MQLRGCKSDKELWYVGNIPNPDHADVMQSNRQLRKPGLCTSAMTNVSDIQIFTLACFLSLII